MQATCSTSPRVRGEVDLRAEQLRSEANRVSGRSHRLRLAELPPHPDSFAALGIRPLPARGERWSMLQRLRDDQLVPVALAAFSKSSITPLPTREAISV